MEVKARQKAREERQRKFMQKLLNIVKYLEIAIKANAKIKFSKRFTKSSVLTTT